MRERESLKRGLIGSTDYGGPLREPERSLTNWEGLSVWECFRGRREGLGGGTELAKINAAIPYMWSYHRLL